MDGPMKLRPVSVGLDVGDFAVGGDGYELAWLDILRMLYGEGPLVLVMDTRFRCLTTS